MEVIHLIRLNKNIVYDWILNTIVKNFLSFGNDLKGFRSVVVFRRDLIKLF